MLGAYPFHEYEDPDQPGIGTTWEGARERDGLVVLSGDCCVRAGCDGGEFTSCPVSQSSQAWALFAVRAWRAWDKGQLHLVERRPSAALLDAVETIASALTALERRRSEDAAKR